MKNIFLAAIAAVAICACGHVHKGEEAHSHEHPVLSATKYSPSVELFVQYDELVAGHKASVTAYVTELPSFKPYAGGAVKVSLDAGGNRESFMVEPAHKGVYRFALSPKEAAVGNLIFEVGGEQLPVHIHIESGEHSHGRHTAHKEEHHGEHPHADVGHAHSHDEHSHAHAGEAAHSHENNISFSKEQSWKIDFATAIATKSSFNGAVKVAARVTATPDNFTTLVAATAGKVQFAGNVVAGKAVKGGEPLFLLDGGNVTDNDVAVKFAEAESNYNVAKSDFERKSELYKGNIVSKRDYEAAEAAFAQAEARYSSMKSSFSSGKSAIKSSINGSVRELLVANGDYVQAGTPLAVIQRDGAMNISAELPVRYAQLLKNVSAVNIELPCGRVCTMDEIDARLTAGTAANGCAMLPVTVTAKHIGDVVPGSVVTLYISSQMQGVERVAVPRGALVEEMGNFFVFVQHTPVSFEKRQVVPGATDGAYVQLLAGLHEGERVVTKGGVSLKLSQGAAALDPHAGHVH
ncbi:MAG: efflux RND transporter periplasmic adaptor subunit [Bacteroidaceae bacterium]|nr:efflux RND transporter periplasmic adaptor subunit [Bacteroidaceae bacterium]